MEQDKYGCGHMSSHTHLWKSKYNKGVSYLFHVDVKD